MKLLSVIGAGAIAVGINACWMPSPPPPPPVVVTQPMNPAPVVVVQQPAQNPPPSGSFGSNPGPSYNNPPSGPQAGGPPSGGGDAPQLLSPPELMELLKPIALYPDPLLAQVLAAAIYPQEIQQAAGMVFGGSPPYMIQQQSWEPPVFAIVEAPEVLRMMSEFPDWTEQVGQAYVWQANDVMQAVQSLRGMAYGNGTLVSGPQMNVAFTGGVYFIEPIHPGQVFVPVYDADVMFGPPPPGMVAAAMMTFGAAVMMSKFWDLDCDWHNHHVSSGHHDHDHHWKHNGKGGDVYKVNKTKVVVKVDNSTTIINKNVNKNVDKDIKIVNKDGDGKGNKDGDGKGNKKVSNIKMPNRKSTHGDGKAMPVRADGKDRNPFDGGNNRDGRNDNDRSNAQGGKKNDDSGNRNDGGQGNKKNDGPGNNPFEKKNDGQGKKNDGQGNKKKDGQEHEAEHNKKKKDGEVSLPVIPAAQTTGG